MKICKAAGCHNPIQADQQNPYCTVHASYYRPREHKRSETKRRSYSQYNKFKRDQEANAFYHSKVWTRISKELKRQAYFTCECCGRTYDQPGYLVVDHVVPRRVNKIRQLDTGNLWVICKRCHYWKGELEKEIYTSPSVIDNIDVGNKWNSDKCSDWILKKELIVDSKHSI
ncbi:HNH endonuclease [Furfurilactobacillus siliginis]|nr:HNH endonuclease [Furfurilactobacillus siliginis]